MKIVNLIGREILDSRGNPTVEAEMFLEDGRSVIASVPSGASTGEREALELRDNDENRYNGTGVLKAVNNINTIIKDAIVGMNVSQTNIDSTLIKLDGTNNKSKLGANAILAVSLCALKAGALLNNKKIYQYVADGQVSMPIPMMNIINGGKHADNNLSIQEFMIVPVVKSFKERLRVGAEIFHTLKRLLKTRGLSTGVGDEGGFAPVLQNNYEALDLIMEAIMESNYVPGKDVYIALDVAATSFYDKEAGKYLFEGEYISADELMKYYITLLSKYPIVSIEDPFYENDFDSLTVFTSIVGNRIMIVGDDYFVTNKKYLDYGIKHRAGNAILLKANQVGTISEMVETIMMAKKHNMKTIISHRSGETEDTFIADLAVGLSIPYIKTGSLSRGERIAKYNQLLRIEEELNR